MVTKSHGRSIGFGTMYGLGIYRLYRVYRVVYPCKSLIGQGVGSRAEGLGYRVGSVGDIQGFYYL